MMGIKTDTWRASNSEKTTGLERGDLGKSWFSYFLAEVWHSLLSLNEKNLDANQRAPQHNVIMGLFTEQWTPSPKPSLALPP